MAEVPAATGADAVEVIHAGVLGSVPHGFLGRRGGVSAGAISGLNTGLGSGDDPASIATNRRLAADAVLPGARLVGVYQVHSPDCVTVTEPWSNDARPHADAMVTNRAGVLLGILTADCAPVLLVDPGAGVIGAAHAGWRGAFEGVIARTVEAMERLGASRDAIAAAIGPCIGRDSYEIDEGFRRRFTDRDAANAQFFVAGRPGHHHFDLESYVAARLREAGVTKVERLGLDTYAEEERFYSFRRATHREEPAYGRQISLIALR